jgi:hypothetical protein
MDLMDGRTVCRHVTKQGKVLFRGVTALEPSLGGQYPDEANLSVLRQKTKVERVVPIMTVR